MRKNSRVKVSQSASLMNTPWMRAEYPDDVVEVLPGQVWFVSTPGRGGFAVSREIASRLSPWAKSQGISKGGYLWFEEDVAWRALTLEIPEFAQADYEQSKKYNDWGTFEEFMAYSVETAMRYLGYKSTKRAQVGRSAGIIGDIVQWFKNLVSGLKGSVDELERVVNTKSARSRRAQTDKFFAFVGALRDSDIQYSGGKAGDVLTINVHLDNLSAVLSLASEHGLYARESDAPLGDGFTSVVVKEAHKRAQTDASPEVEAAIKEFLALKKQIAELNKRKGEIQGELVSVFENAEKEMVRADGIVYKAIQHDVPSPSYAKAFSAALTKVNAATRKILEAVLEAHTTIGDRFNLRPVKSAFVGIGIYVGNLRVDGIGFTDVNAAIAYAQGMEDGYRREGLPVPPIEVRNYSGGQLYKKEWSNNPLDKKAQTFNYTGHGWEGESYDRSLSTKDIAAKVREYVKSKYPAYKFSIRYESFAGGSAINVSLMSGPEEPFADGKGYEQLNQFYLDQSGLRQPVLDMMKDVYRYISSFNFDDSDAQIDYFHTNFYVHLEVGKWDKPYAKTAKTAMMLLTKEVEARMPALYATESTPTADKVVQVKFFTPDSNWSWFGIEYDPTERVFFGLVAGLYPEFGYFSLDELESVTGPMGLSIERDMYFSPKTVAEVVRTEGVDIHVAESKKPTPSMLAARPVRKHK